MLVIPAVDIKGGKCVRLKQGRAEDVTDFGDPVAAAMHAGLRSDGKGMLIPIARAISRAEDPAKAAAEFRDSMISIQYARTRGQP